MNPRELKRAMRAQRKQLRAQIAAHPLVQQARKKRRLRRAVLSAIALLLLLFVRCECGAGPLPEPETPDAGLEEPRDAGARDAGTPPKKRAPILGKVDAQPRGDLGPQGKGTPPWLDEFRIQVAARSPRLAECFTGIESPGALRWSAAVNPNGGTVSDHELATVGVGADLSKEQRTCVLGVLSSPPYRLTVPGTDALPNRVSLVIEF